MGDGCPFIGCYLLRSDNKLYKGSTYIGFTVNPKRRIRQHNGLIANGAYKTKRKRPWTMCVVVHGFPNKVAGLQFEWAWQNPRRSRFVRHLYPKNKRAPGGLRGKLQVLLEMVNLLPWRNYPLHVHYTDQEFYDVAQRYCRAPPAHVEALVGPIEDLPLYQRTDFSALDIDLDSDAEAAGLESKEPAAQESSACGRARGSGPARPLAAAGWRCALCGEGESKRKHVCCIRCSAHAHMLCLARAARAMQNEAGDSSPGLIPASGTCPECGVQFRWPTLVEACTAQAGQRQEREKQRAKRRARELKKKNRKGASRKRSGRRRNVSGKSSASSADGEGLAAESDSSSATMSSMSASSSFAARFLAGGGHDLELSTVVEGEEGAVAAGGDARSSEPGAPLQRQFMDGPRTSPLTPPLTQRNLSIGGGRRPNVEDEDSEALSSSSDDDRPRSLSQRIAKRFKSNDVIDLSREL